MAPALQSAAVAAVDAVETLARTRTLPASTRARQAMRRLASLSDGALPAPISEAWEPLRSLLGVTVFPPPRPMSSALAVVASLIRAHYHIVPRPSVPLPELNPPPQSPEPRKESPDVPRRRTRRPDKD